MAIQISIEHSKTIYCTETTHQALRHGRHVFSVLRSVTFGTIVAQGCRVVCKLRLVFHAFCLVRPDGIWLTEISDIQYSSVNRYMHM
jgi:hypothetical protein